MAGDKDKVELRIDISAELARNIDAMMMVDNLKSRGEFVVPIIERAIRIELHRATVLLRCAGINPLASSPSGKAGE
jgi:metal-responsive CopG/Arc/MetJ family transcriptional regulator